MDAARLNFSHGGHDDHLQRLQAVRRAQDVVGRPLAVIADLQGPKIRVGVLADPRTVNPGDVVVLAAAGEGGPGDLELTFPGLASIVREGSEILIDDGLVRLRVTETGNGRVTCRTEVGGVISSSKGVNLPGHAAADPVADGQGRRAISHSRWPTASDYVALSFVRKPDDLHDLRERIAAAGSDARIIAKIEKAEALEHLDEIVEASDARDGGARRPGGRDRRRRRAAGAEAGRSAPPGTPAVR